MLLAIDIGNTNTVFALFDDEALTHEWRCETVPARGSEDYTEIFEDVLKPAGLGASDIHDVIISSVVPGANGNIEQFCVRYLKRYPVFVSRDMVDVPIDMDKPEEVGADRIVNAAAVIAHYQCPAIVLDFGTATTFDVINAKGHYMGGVIAPGIKLSLAALEQAAAKLPGIEIEKPARAIGKDTISAMQAGIYHGYKGLIEGIVADITAEMDGTPFVIATGGLARLFGDNMDIINEIDQTLTLKGLLKIYQDYKRQTL